MSAPGAPTASFPHQDEFARKFFGEAVRHLDDARVLHQARRYPGAITSSQKSAELAIKAVLVLEGCLGWWDQIQQTHRPLNETQNHRVLTHHFQMLQNYSATLTTRIKDLELLSPGKPDLKDFKPEAQVNTEYPFFYLLSPPNGPATTHFQGPSEYFTDTDSLGHYRTTHELLTAYESLYPAVKRWRHRLPRAL